MMKEVTKWLLTYFPVAWSAHICQVHSDHVMCHVMSFHVMSCHVILLTHFFSLQGLVMGILGPSQPYLAHMVGVGSREINFIWTVLAGGSCLATLGVGAVFKVRTELRS